MAAVTRVYTLALVAEMLDEDPDWLSEICDEMEPEDGHLWIYGPNDQQIEGFTPAGLDCLTDIVREYKANPDLIPQPPRRD